MVTNVLLGQPFIMEEVTSALRAVHYELGFREKKVFGLIELLNMISLLMICLGSLLK